MILTGWAFFASMYLTVGAVIIKTKNMRSFLVFRAVPFLIGISMVAWAVSRMVVAS